MTLPRQVIPDCDYMITRRCSERRFFLRPDDETNNAFLYCLGLAAQRAKVEVTFSEAMSNHHHTGIRDTEGSFPIFAEHFHGLLARGQNAALRGRGSDHRAPHAEVGRGPRRTLVAG